jgi:hypothetical protein
MKKLCWQEAADYLAWLYERKLIDGVQRNQFHADLYLTLTHSTQEQEAIQKLINLNPERFVTWRVQKRLTGN